MLFFPLVYYLPFLTKSFGASHKLTSGLKFSKQLDDMKQKPQRRVVFKSMRTNATCSLLGGICALQRSPGEWWTFQLYLYTALCALRHPEESGKPEMPDGCHSGDTSLPARLSLSLNADGEVPYLSTPGS
jgi:hypothetical protein